MKCMPAKQRTDAEFAENLLHDEAACFAYLESTRWPNGPRCPNCQNEDVLTMQSPYYRCNSDDCGGYDFTLRSKTLLEGSRLPLRLWFQAVWYFVNQQHGVSAVALQRHLGIGSNHTALRLLKTIKQAVTVAVQDQLSGSVDVDEFYLDGKKFSKVGGNLLVMIAVQTGTSSKVSLIRLLRVTETTPSGLTDAVSKIIRAGSNVSTDAWIAYAGLRRAGFKHVKIRDSANLGNNLLPKPKRVALLLQRWLEAQPTPTSVEQLDYHLNEFAFRFNPHNANPSRTLFKRLIEQIVTDNDTSAPNSDLWNILREVSPSASDEPESYSEQGRQDETVEQTPMRSRAPMPNRLKSLYRELVRRLHPDSEPNQTTKIKELWHKVQAAYERKDTVQLQVILTRFNQGAR